MPVCGYERYEIEYLLHFKSGRFFCGSGLGSTSVDRVFLRDIRGNAIIPGTHLKGIVRQRCEELLSALGGAVIDVHRGEGLDKDTSLISRAFGRPGPYDVVCVFDDVNVSEEEVIGDVRNRVRMNRRLGRPERHALFDTEYAVDLGEGKNPQVGKVTLWVKRANGEKVPPEVTLVCAGLRLVDGVGGDKSTGGGKVELSVRKVMCDSGDGVKDYGIEDILSPMRDEKGLSEWFPSGEGGAS